MIRVFVVEFHLCRSNVAWSQCRVALAVELVFTVVDSMSVGALRTVVRRRWLGYRRNAISSGTRHSLGSVLVHLVVSDLLSPIS